MKSLFYLIFTFLLVTSTVYCDSSCKSALGVHTFPYMATNDISQLNTPILFKCQNRNNLTSSGNWYTLKPPSDKITVISTCPDTTNFDTLLSLYRGCPDDGQVIDSDYVTCNDDGCADLDGFSMSSRIVVHNEKNDTYWLLVSGFNGAVGTYSLEIYMEDVIQPKKCQDAEVIPAIPYTLSGNTENSAFSIDTCGEEPRRAQGVWYKFVGTGDRILLDTCDQDTTFDTTIQVYTACHTEGGEQCVGENGDCFGDDCFLQSCFAFDTVKDQDYFIFVTGFRETVGQFVLHATLATSTQDQCDSSVDIVVLPFYDRQTIASYTRESDDLCDPSTDKRKGLWYSFLGHGNKVTASTCDPDIGFFDTILEIYTGSCQALACVDYNDDYCGAHSEVTWMAEKNTEYRIFVGGFGNVMGEYILNLYDAKNSTNDQCVAAKPITILPFSDQMNTANAALSHAACDKNKPARPGYWFLLEGDDYTYTVSTCNLNTNFKSSIEVYTECFVEMDKCYIRSQANCIDTPDRAAVNFKAHQGKSYYIFVSGIDEHQKGYYDLTVSRTTHNTNALCSFPLEISRLPWAITGYTGNSEASWTNCNDYQMFAEWFKKLGTGNKIIAETCGLLTDFDTYIEVYDSCELQQVNHTICVAEDDDSCGTQSRVEWDSMAGQEYWIDVHGKNGAVGVFQLMMYEAVAPQASSCNTPKEITFTDVGIQVIDFETVKFAHMSEGWCLTDRMGRVGIWYTILEKDIWIHASTCDGIQTMDTVIEVYEDCQDNIASYCTEGVKVEQCESGLGQRISWYSPADRSTPYYVFVSTPLDSSELGFFEVSFMKGSSVIPHKNRGGLVIAIFVLVIVISSAAYGGWFWMRKRRFAYSPLR